MRLRNQSIYIPMNTTSRSVNVLENGSFYLMQKLEQQAGIKLVAFALLFKKKSVKNTLSVGENTNDLFTQTFVQLCRDVR